MPSLNEQARQNELNKREKKLLHTGNEVLDEKWVHKCDSLSFYKCLMHTLCHVSPLLLRITLQACPFSLWNYDAATAHPIRKNDVDSLATSKIRWATKVVSSTDMTNTSTP